MQATVNSVLAWPPSSPPSVRGEGRPLRVSWVVCGYSPHPRQTWRLFGGIWSGTVRALVSSGQVCSTAYTLLRRTKSGGGRRRYFAAAAPRRAEVSNSKLRAKSEQNPTTALEPCLRFSFVSIVT